MMPKIPAGPNNLSPSILAAVRIALPARLRRK
jgi:hypothetical protein